METHPPHCSPGRPSLRPLRGFTLIELLTVVSLMLVIMGIGVPLATGLFGPVNFSSSLAKVSNLIDQARQHAVAANTHVWVAFHQANASTAPEQLAIAIIASRDGTNPIDWNQTYSVPNNELDLIHKVEWAKAVRLPSSISGVTLVSASQAAPRREGEPLAETLTFRIRVPQGGDLSFDRVICFNPRGEASVGAVPVDYADLFLQQVQGRRTDSPNLALIQVNALTGFSRVYRQ